MRVTTRGGNIAIIDLRRQEGIPVSEPSGLRRRTNPVFDLSRKGRTRIHKLYDAGVTVVTCTHRTKYLERIFENYWRQNYPRKELIIVINHDDIDIDEFRRGAASDATIQVYKLGGNTSLGECYNFAVDKSQYSFIAKFDDDDYYAPQFLADTMLAFQETQADIIGKTCRYVYFESNAALALCGNGLESQTVPYVVGATMVFRKYIFDRVKFRSITSGEDSEFQSDCLAHGFRIYSIDRYNYVTIRHPDTEPHTFHFDDAPYLSQCQFITHTHDFPALITKNRAFYV